MPAPAAGDQKKKPAAPAKPAAGAAPAGKEGKEAKPGTAAGKQNKPGGGEQAQDKTKDKKGAEQQADPNKAGEKGGPGQGAKKAGAGHAQAAAGDKAAAPTAAGAGQSAQRADRMAVRAKLALSQPGDAVEREADAVADRVARKLDAPGGAEQQNKQQAAGPQAAGAKPAAPATPAAQPAKAATEQPVARAISPAANEAKDSLDAMPKRETHEGSSEAPDSDQLRERIKQQLGRGQAMEPDLRVRMEQEFGQSFAHVRIHSDAQANELCKGMHALAFTTGSDIFFASGCYNPASSAGRALLAHELTHVVQHQSAPIGIARKINPAMPDKYKEKDAAKTASALANLGKLEIPAVKARHLGRYKSLIGTLARKAGYERGNPDQVSVWNKNVKVSDDRIRERLKDRGITPPADNSTKFKVKLGNGAQQSTSIDKLKNLLKIPTWSKTGQAIGTGYQVDHIVELQVSGENGTGTGNDLKNMELLDQPSNSSSGGAIRAKLYSKVDAYLETFKPAPKRQQFLKKHDIVFESVTANLSGGAAASSWWSLEEIEDAKPVDKIAPAPASDKEGTDKEFLLLAAPGGVVVQKIKTDPPGGSYKIEGLGKTAISGLILESASINAQQAEKGSGSVGTLSGKWNLPKKWQPANPDQTVGLEGDGKYRGYPATLGSLKLDFAHLSPVEFKEVEIDQGQIQSDGLLKPSVALFKAPITVALRGQDVRFSMQYGTGPLDFGASSVSIDDALINVSYSLQSGFGVEGGVDYSIDKIGGGSLRAGFSEGEGISVSGSFMPDTDMFDTAKVEAWWKEKGGFGAKGELAITKPNKIKGLKSAHVNAKYENGAFSATGTAETSIPGVKSFGVALEVKPEGTTISGDADLGTLPGVEAAKLHLSLDDSSGAWKLKGSGDITPKLPKGFTGNFQGSYDDGLVLIKGHLGFNRDGVFHGSIDAGVTNGEVDASGKLLGGKGGDKYKAFGAADITATIPDTKIEGHAGLRLLPDGSTRIKVDVKLGEAQVFERYPKGETKHDLLSLESPPIPVPGFGITVGNVALGLNVSASGSIYYDAWVGPGSFKDVHVETAEEIDPANFTIDTLKLSGGGQFVVPAHVGLGAKAAVNAALSAGAIDFIGYVDVHADIGVDPKIEAKTDFTWSKAEGLNAKGDVGVSLSPNLSLGLGGGFKARANIIVDKITLWEKHFDGPHVELPLGVSLGEAKIGAHYSSISGPKLDAPEIKPPSLSVSDVASKILGSGDEKVENREAHYDDELGICYARDEHATQPAPTQSVHAAAGAARPASRATPASGAAATTGGASRPTAAQTHAPGKTPAHGTQAGAGAAPHRAGGRTAVATALPQAHTGAAAGGAAAAAGKTAAQEASQLPDRLMARLGEGKPLPAGVRENLEREVGGEFSAVRIHDDANADAAARSLQARAFTRGEHIVFAAGRYDPRNPEGVRLLAHELTHVVQHDNGVTRSVMRTPDPPAAGSASSTPPPAPTASGASAASAPTGGAGSGGAPTAGAPEYRITTPLQIPPIKSRHASTYATKAAHNVLRRPRAYDSATRATAQIPNWLGGVTIDLSTAALNRYRPATGAPWSLPLQAAGGATARTVTAASDAELIRQLKIPNWDAFGADQQFQVDHMVEFQLGGQDDISNLELLNQAYNGSVGSSFNIEINRAIRTNLASTPPPAAPGLTIPTPATHDFVKQNYDVVFTSVQGRGRESGRRERDSRFWSKSAIESLEHVTSLLPGAGGSLAGTASQIVLQSPTGALVIGRFAVSGGNLVVSPAQASAIAGFTIDNINLTVAASALGGTTTPAGTPVGSLEGTLNLGPAVTIAAGQRYALQIVKANEEFAVKIGATPVPGPNPAGPPNLVPATFTPLSPMEISNITLGRSVYAQAFITPSHPALSGLRLPAQIREGRLGLFYTVDAGTLAERLRIPGLTVDSASITLGYNGSDFSVAGGAEFTIRNFGQGQLQAMLDSAGHFQLEGGFRADTRLFDRADLRLWYRSEGGFGGSGTLAITNPNKIRGVRGASVTASYDNGVFNANGTVEPNIPGVQSAGLQVTYGRDESGADSLLIGGDLMLAAGIPGLSGGQVHVQLQQINEAWHVSAAGDIQPDLPGLNPNIHVTYDDGLFTGELSVSYARSIFSGNVTVGLTNRAVTPDGELSGTEPGEELHLYGNGTLNARITEWLQGGVGIRVRPNGTLLISGSIGIPAAVTVFDQYPAAPHDRRTLFSMPTLSIPLVGAPGVGVSLNISGGIDGYAHIGPGQLTTATVNVVDFDPAQPESLHITGHANFEVPAAAGVDARMDAGLAAGAVISLEAGLGVSAGVAVEARARTGVDLDWQPSTGLHLHADLAASLSPKLRFDLHGYARVIAGAFGVNWELWRKDWQLAQREMGSNLALGINVPVDYYSDERGVVFDPERVTFQVPSLNADTLSQLLNDNGSEHREEGHG